MADEEAFGFDARTVQRLIKMLRQWESAPNRRGRSDHFPTEPDIGVTFKNMSGEDIPPYSCVKIRGLDDPDEFVFKGFKPDNFGSQWWHFFTGREWIADQERGFATAGPPVWACFDPGLDPGNPIEPEAGEAWGPLNDSWKLHKNVGGWRVEGGSLKEKEFDRESEYNRMVVTRSPLLSLIVKTDEDIEVGAEGDCTPMYEDVQPGEYVEHAEETIKSREAIGGEGTIVAGSICKVSFEPTYKPGGIAGGGMIIVAVICAAGTS